MPNPDGADSWPVVLLTGASAGLGLALANRLKREPLRLVLTARQASLDRFQALGIRESDQLWLRGMDVTVAREREAVVREVRERWGGVDALVNNAGIAYRTVVEHFGKDDFHHVMDVNFFGPMHLIRLVLPEMRRKRAGRIISVSSVGGMMAMPTMALYSASKFALEGACEALWYEVRPWKIHVTLVQPGFVNSRSFENTLYTAESRAASENLQDPYHGHYLNMTRLIERLMKRSRATPDEIARRIVHVLQHPNPPLRTGVTADATFFGLLRRLLPRGLYHSLLYRRLPGIHQWGRTDGE